MQKIQKPLLVMPTDKNMINLPKAKASEVIQVRREKLAQAKVLINEGAEAPKEKPRKRRKKVVG